MTPARPDPTPEVMAAPTRPACVSRLRIYGFKTFADPVALDILPGLTGLVGPNGCGKSNVVDALRWAMGEGNARALRGAEMEEVIFAGTAVRPGLHQAEVALTLDGGSFPAPFADLAVVQVTRRIEREAGSVYQVNGRDARARDVQAPFAGLAGGARSFAREHSKSRGADRGGVGYGLTGRGWAGAEAGAAGEADCGAAAWGDNGNRGRPH